MLQLTIVPEMVSDAELLPKNKYGNVKFKDYVALRDNLPLNQYIVNRYAHFLMDGLDVEKGKFVVFSPFFMTYS